MSSVITEILEKFTNGDAMAMTIPPSFLPKTAELKITACFEILKLENC